MQGPEPIVKSTGMIQEQYTSSLLEQKSTKVFLP
jgi:hypothetical protein